MSKASINTDARDCGLSYSDSLDKKEKYIIIDKINEFGYQTSKYAGMFNMTKMEFAKVFENKSDAEKISNQLNKAGYNTEVVRYMDSLLYIINNQAQKMKKEATDNVTQNRMWSIIHAVEKLEQELKVV